MVNQYCVVHRDVSEQEVLEMPEHQLDRTEFWESWEEYFIAKNQKDPRTSNQATICLGKLQELAGSQDEQACAQSIRNSFIDVSEKRAAGMYQELVADAKAHSKNSRQAESVRLGVFTQ
jgi:hypothetical protein